MSQVHLPAVNTPQSLRQRNKTQLQQQPVPPLFDPAAIAELIVSAADGAPREWLVGIRTARAVWGQRLLPAYLERRAARDAWESQFVDVANKQEDDILFTTLPGDPGAHGPYRDRQRGPDLLMRSQRRAASVSRVIARRWQSLLTR